MSISVPTLIEKQPFVCLVMYEENVFSGLGNLLLMTNYANRSSHTLGALRYKEKASSSWSEAVI